MEGMEGMDGMEGWRSKTYNFRHAKIMLHKFN